MCMTSNHSAGSIANQFLTSTRPSLRPYLPSAPLAAYVTDAATTPQLVIGSPTWRHVPASVLFPTPLGLRPSLSLEGSPFSHNGHSDEMLDLRIENEELDST